MTAFEIAWNQDAAPVKAHNTDCSCAPDPQLKNPGCTLCVCGSSKPFSYGGATLNGECGGLKTSCPTTLNYYNTGYKSDCKCAPDPLKRGPRYVVCKCPAARGALPPTPQLYSNWPATNKSSPLMPLWPVCQGRYAYCGIANCTVDFKGKEKSPIWMAECGCTRPLPSNQLTDQSYVDPNYILDRQLAEDYKKQCPDYGNSPGCSDPNSTKICRWITKNWIYGGRYQYISTYTRINQSETLCVGTKPGNTMYYANCMTAACFDKPAFDGSPVTCYCVVMKDVKYLVGGPAGSGRPSCKPNWPYLLSGATKNTV